jgi:hypothetical protein
MKLYVFLDSLPKKINSHLLGFSDKIIIHLSRSFIAVKFYLLFLLFLSPIKTAKLLTMRISPNMARKLKYIIYGRYYMK